MLSIEWLTLIDDVKKREGAESLGQRQPLERITMIENAEQESILNLIVHELDTEISSFAIEETEPLWDDEEEVNHGSLV